MFQMVNLDVRQSRRANDSASIVKRAKKDLAISKVRESAAEDSFFAQTPGWQPKVETTRQHETFSVR